MTDDQKLELKWKLSEKQGNKTFFEIGAAFVNVVIEAARDQMPDLAEMFPLKENWDVRGHFGDGWIAIRLSSRYGAGVPTVGRLEGKEVEELISKTRPLELKSHQELFKLLGPNWFAFDKFTYVGPYENSYACWPHASDHLVDWLNSVVIPEILKRNQARVLRAIPPAPQINIERILRSLWILECEKSMRQGTAFHLSNVGLVTCEHVLGPVSNAFKAKDLAHKYPIAVRVKQKEIDLAILTIDAELGEGLDIGSADNLKQMDHLAIAGFPNYRVGDSGVIIPGLVVGFRMVSGIRRILTNASIVAGASGGPVFDKNNLVIGVAVTGAEIMEKAQETENHGVIPIDALKYLA